MEWIVASLVSVALTLLNNSALIYYFLKRPPETIYIGISHWYEDFFFYLSQVAQGASGNWFLVNQFTTESIPSNINWITNLILGKVGGVIGLSPWNSYHAALIIFSLVYLLLLYFVAKQIYPKETFKCWFTYLFALTASGFSTFFYSYTTPFNRIGGVPHLVLQNILSLLLIIQFSQIIEFKNQNITRMIFFVLTVSLLFIINPVYVLVDGIVLSLASVILLIQSKSRRLFQKLFILGVFTLIPLVLLGLYLQRVFEHPYYHYFRSWEANIPPTTIPKFLYASGVILLLYPLGFKRFLRHENPLRLVGALFATVPIILYFSPIPRLLNLPYFRFLQPPAYIFLAAIAAQGIETLTQKRKFAVILGAVILALQIPVVWQEAKDKLIPYYLNSNLNYIPLDVWQGLKVLEGLPHDGNVLATDNMELIVPFSTGFTVYSAHRSLTWQYEYKVSQVQRFYTAMMDPDEAQSFLKNNDIRYIVWLSIRPPPVYPLLKNIWKNEAISIYTWQ